LEWYEKSVALKEALGDKAGLAATYNNIAYIHVTNKNAAAALEFGQKAVAIAQKLGSLPDVAGILWSLSYFSIVALNLPQAKQYAQESLRLYVQLKLEKKAAEVRAWMKENGLG
jgi:hypothetical protein